VKQILKSLQHIIDGITIALENKQQYSYLVHDGSIHYRNISRALFRDGVRKYLTSTMAFVVNALKEVDDKDISWRVKYTM
jgi:hypothetical protein